MTTRVPMLLAAILIAAQIRPVQAHHSTAVFALDKMIELRGVVVDFKLRSPHSSLIVDARAFADGQSRGAGVERWEIEWEALAGLRTVGVEPSTFKPGDAVTIKGYPHRDPTFRFMHATVVTALNGKEYSFFTSDRLYSPSLKQAVEASGGKLALKESPGVVAGAHGIARLVGRWQQPVTLPTGTESVLPLNAAGVAARSSYDRKLSPANTCEPMSVPDVFMAPFYLFEVRLDGQRVVLHNEAYDVSRTVLLSGEAAPADPRGHFGIAKGRLEGDTFIVESSGFPASKWGLGAEVQLFGAGADVPSSVQKTLTERYTVAEDGRTLVLDYTLNDPEYMTKPYSGRVELTRVPDTSAIYPYECDPESAAMWSRDAKDKALRVGK
jgi:hypothetical protein